MMGKRAEVEEGKKQLYCCSSYYQVFIALIKALVQGQVIDLILEEHGIETARQLAGRLEAQMQSCVDRVFVCPDSKNINPYRQRCSSFLPWQRRQILRHVEAVFAGTENPGAAVPSEEIRISESKPSLKAIRSFRSAASPGVIAARLRAYQGIHVFWDLGYAGTYLNIRRIPYILYEDSLNSYQHIRANRPNYAYIFRKNGWKFKIKKRFHLGVIPFGYSDNCVAVEVNEKAGIEIPLDKVREVSRKDLISRLTKEQKKEIFALFVAGEAWGSEEAWESGKVGGSEEAWEGGKVGESGKAGGVPGEKENLQDNEEDCRVRLDGSEDKEGLRFTLLLTEPFAVTGRLPDEKAQVRLYRDVLARYAKNSQVLIKPHPRDSLDYRKFFPDARVMEKNIPMEVLNFDEHFRVFRAVTVSSSAVEGLTCAQEKIYLGQDILHSYRMDVPGSGV